MSFVALTPTSPSEVGLTHPDGFCGIDRLGRGTQCKGGAVTVLATVFDRKLDGNA
jgi:hypothetical protein